MSLSTTIVFTFFFFFNDTATTEIYTLSLHDALPIYAVTIEAVSGGMADVGDMSIMAPEHRAIVDGLKPSPGRSEEHTSELQSRQYLVCRLLLEKKKINTINLDK